MFLTDFFCYSQCIANSEFSSNRAVFVQFKIFSALKNPHILMCRKIMSVIQPFILRAMYLQDVAIIAHPVILFMFFFFFFYSSSQTPELFAKAYQLGTRFFLCDHLSSDIFFERLIFYKIRFAVTRIINSSCIQVLPLYCRNLNSRQIKVVFISK